MESQEKESKMGCANVKKLLLFTGLPMIVSMVLQALYNIVDSAFVSNMSENGEAALNALTLAFPAQMLLVAVAIGTGVGANALLSRSLGQGDRDKASRVAGNALFLGLAIYAVFLIFGLSGVRAYIDMQTKDALTAEMAAQYLQICCVWSLGIVLFSVYEKLLQATGRSLFSTVAQIAGAVTNIVLDPLLIYGLCGLPEMGIRGAAVATVVGQFLSFALALLFHLTKNKEISNRLRYIKPSGKLIAEIYAVGLPAIVSQALMSAMTFGMNLILGGKDETYVTAYGLYYKIQQFVLFAAFGMRDAITPVVSYNFGKKDAARVKSGIFWGMVYTGAIMLLGLAVLEIFARPLAAVFGLSGITQELCVQAMRLISLGFLFAGANIALQGVFQALGCGFSSLAISVCRQLLFVLPLAWAFAALGSDALLWLTFLFAETASLIAACALMKSAYRKKIRSL